MTLENGDYHRKGFKNVSKYLDLPGNAWEVIWRPWMIKWLIWDVWLTQTQLPGSYLGFCVTWHNQQSLRTALWDFRQSGVYTLSFHLEAPYCTVHGFYTYAREQTGFVISDSESLGCTPSDPGWNLCIRLAVNTMFPRVSRVVANDKQQIENC